MKKLWVWVLLTGSLFSENKWIEISASDLPYSKVENYMRADIDYVELRKMLYSNKTDKPVSDKYIPYYTIARKPLNTYSKKTIKSFRKLKFLRTNLATIANFYGSPRHHSYRVNGFIIKKDGTFLVFNEDVDIGWLFNGIDNLPKLLAYLNITNTFARTQKKINGKYQHSLIYRKTDNGYEIKSMNDRGIRVSKETLTRYHTYDVTLYSITKEGKLTVKKLEPFIEKEALSKDFFKEMDGSKLIPVVVEITHADPVWAFYSEKEMVEMELKNPKMIKP